MYRFQIGDTARVLNRAGGYYLCAGLVQERQIHSGRQCPIYRLFGQHWFFEHELEPTE